MKFRLFKNILCTSTLLMGGCLAIIPTLSTQTNQPNQTSEIITTGNIRHTKNVQVVNSVDEIIIENIMFSPKNSYSGAAIVNNNGKQEIYVWGANSYGQLGLGHKNTQLTPALLSSDLLGNYTSITELILQANSSFAKVNTDAGEQIYAWGRNDYGQLGLGNIVNKDIPTIFETTYFADLVRIKKLSFFDSNKIVSDSQYAIIEAVDGNEKLYVWGRNDYGQLGNNSTTNLNVPTLFDTTQFGDYVNIKEIEINYSGYAILTTLTNEEKIFVWGYNSSGQLGNGNTTNQLAPIPFTSFISGATIRNFEINWHSRSNMILRRDNVDELYTWGNNSNGQLGTGNESNYSTPQRIPNSSFGNANEIISMTVPVSTSVLKVKINAEEKLYVWGGNEVGQLGLGNTSKYLTPTLFSNSRLGNYTQIYAINSFDETSFQHYNQAYVKTPNGDELYVWGDNSNGQLGLGNTTNQSTPVKNDAFNLNNGNSKIVKMFPSNDFFNSVIIEQNGELSLYSTGRNSSGQNATGSTSNTSTFTSALPARRTMPYSKNLMAPNLTPAEALLKINPKGVIDLNELNKYVDTTSFPSGSTFTINSSATTAHNEIGELSLAINTNKYYDLLVKDMISANKTYKVNISGFRKATNINVAPVKVLAESFDVPNNLTIDKLYNEIVDSNSKVINRILLEQYLDLTSIPPTAELFLYRDTHNSEMQSTFTLDSNQVYSNGIAINQSYSESDLLIVIFYTKLLTSQLNASLVIGLSFAGIAAIIIAIIMIYFVRKAWKRKVCDFY